MLDAIYKKLEEDPENENLQRQITLLNMASICTIDSFCLEVVKNNFFELNNVSPNFRIADTPEIELLKQEILDDIFEKKYEEDDSDFTKLVNTYTSYKDDTPLKDLILKIHGYIGSSPFPKEWLHEKIEMFNLDGKLNEDFSKTPWGSVLLEELDEELIDDIAVLEDARESLTNDKDLEIFEQIIASDIKQLKTLQDNLQNWDSAYEIAQNIKFQPWSRKKVESEIKAEAKEIRDTVKEKFNKKIGKILTTDSKQSNQDIFDMYDILKKLEKLILEFDEVFSKRKREKNIVDFTDIEHFALEILVKKDEKGNVIKTDVAKKYTEKFQEIAIDEYQDSNLVQEYILTSISKGNNIFMVGDVKQSIYKFRQARPDLFLSKYKTYKLKQNKTENDDLKIQLFKNFRSRKEVLDFSNLIFSKIMTEELGELNYTEEEYLNLGADYKDTGEDLKTEIDIITIDNKEDEEEPEELEVEVDENEDTQDEEFKTEVERKEDIEVEAMFVANKIKQLIDNKFQVYDAKAKEKRDIKYKDIVVLLRSTKISAPIFEKEIIKLGIPVFSDSSSEYLESLEIQTIMNLLKIIDNPLQEIPLVATMRSTIGGFTDNELVEIRLSDKYDNFYNTLLKSKKDVSEQLRNKINKFLEQIEMWRKEQEYLSLDELIWKIYNDTGYFNYVGLMRNGELRQANLKMLFERAKQCESISFKGLYNFINYIEKIKTSSKDMDSAKIIGENDDVVRIMSIHKSKGLEFPVVILANSGKQFNLQDLNSKILLHPELGIGVKYIDYDMQITYDTLSKRAIKNKMKIETLSEEMRVLYVALTRAKEKIIITGLAKKEKQDKMLENVEKYDELNIMLLSKSKSYLDWITLVHLYYEQTMESLATWNVLQKEDIIKMCATQEPEKEENKTDEILKKLNEFKIEDVKANEIQKLLEYQYKYSDATIIPTKTSVTEIKEMKKSALGEKSKKEAENTKMKQCVFREENESEKENIVSKVEFPKPKFLQSDEKTEISNAEKGTLIHLCMQKLDINKKEYTIQDVKELLDKLVAKKTITEQEANAINIKKIYQFTKSNIWQEMTEAQVVEREKPFYINIPAQEIYEKDLEEKVLVQGVIDLYYISSNGELVLVDFKTDYVPDKNEQILIERYSSQLQLYKRALESATGKRVDKTYIYSTYLEKEIKI